MYKYFIVGQSNIGNKLKTYLEKDEIFTMLSLQIQLHCAVFC